MSHRMGQPHLSPAQCLPCGVLVHRDGSLAPCTAASVCRKGSREGTGLLRPIFVTTFVRADGVQSCPADTSGHETDIDGTCPDTKTDMRITVFDSESRGLCPPDMDGHGLKLMQSNTPQRFKVNFDPQRVGPRCPDMHVCARRDEYLCAREGGSSADNRRFRATGSLPANAKTTPPEHWRASCQWRQAVFVIPIRCAVARLLGCLPATVGRGIIASVLLCIEHEPGVGGRPLGVPFDGCD